MSKWKTSQFWENVVVEPPKFTPIALHEKRKKVETETNLFSNAHHRKKINPRLLNFTESRNLWFFSIESLVLLLMNPFERFPANSLDQPNDLPIGRVTEKFISMSMTDCDWLELPGDVLSVIIDKVISSSSLSDYIRFAAVCSKWRCFCLDNYQHIKIPNRTPILVKLLNDDIRLKCDDPEPPNGETFYSLYENKGYYFQLPIPFYTECRGSNHGWIITEAKNDHSVRLLNPFRSVNNEIQIPPSVKWVDNLDHSQGGVCWPIKKAVLSTSPSSNPNDFILMAICDNYMMGFYKSGGENWTIIKRKVIDDCRDVLYYKGHFFVITYRGSLLVIDSRTLDSDEPKVGMFIEKPPIHVEHHNDLRYLVESSGDLLLVYRLYLNETIVFKVFKFVEFSKWVEVKTLEGHILFLSNNGSMSVSASDLPGSKPNCIYFAGIKNVVDRPFPDLWLQGHIGIFNLEDESFEPHYVMKSRDLMIALNWIQPTL